MRTVLPARHEVQQVHAFGLLAVLLALGARELNAHGREHGLPGALVAHADEARVEVDLARECADREQRRAPDDHQRRDRLVEEAGVHVRGLLEDQDVAAGALGRPDLPAHPNG